MLEDFDLNFFCLNQNTADKNEKTLVKHDEGIPFDLVFYGEK
jgi:hypothetical protein